RSAATPLVSAERPAAVAELLGDPQFEEPPPRRHPQEEAVDEARPGGIVPELLSGPVPTAPDPRPGRQERRMILLEDVAPGDVPGHEPRGPVAGRSVHTGDAVEENVAITLDEIRRNLTRQAKRLRPARFPFMRRGQAAAHGPAAPD